MDICLKSAQCRYQRLRKLNTDNILDTQHSKEEVVIGVSMQSGQKVQMNNEIRNQEKLTLACDTLVTNALDGQDIQKNNI